jgi:hypothetical protein
MSMSASIKEPSFRTTTQRVCDHVQDSVQTSRHIADIYVKSQAPNYLNPLEVFKKGQTVMKIGWQWMWINEGSYNIPVRRISNTKFELDLNPL